MPRPALPALLALAALVLAGCSGGGGGGGSDDGSPDTPGPDGGSSGGGGGSAPDGNGTASAPEWQAGDWWDWELESPSVVGTLEATTAVLSADAAGYQVGSPDPAAAAQIYPFHLLPLGALDRTTLAWEAHGLPVSLLRFPLQDGDQWTTDMWATDGADVLVRAALVQGPDGPEPGYRINMTYPGQPDTLVLSAYWSPARGQFVLLETYFGLPSPFASLSLVAQGTNFTGEVRPFVATELVRWTATAANPPSLAPQTFTVADGMDTILMACFLGGGQGEFRAAMLPPDNQPYNCAATVTGTERAYLAHSQPTAPGTGQVAAFPAGQGSAVVEIFGIDTLA